MLYRLLIFSWQPRSRHPSDCTIRSWLTWKHSALALTYVRLEQFVDVLPPSVSYMPWFSTDTSYAFHLASHMPYYSLAVIISLYPVVLCSNNQTDIFTNIFWDFTKVQLDSNGKLKPERNMERIHRRSMVAMYISWQNCKWHLDFFWLNRNLGKAWCEIQRETFAIGTSVPEKDNSGRMLDTRSTCM